jgi:hypothetical protein
LEAAVAVAVDTALEAAAAAVVAVDTVLEVEAAVVMVDHHHTRWLTILLLTTQATYQTGHQGL